ncbi:MAG: GvpL/GvpF family gas vesicle protein [Hyphomicrobium sp.]|uniref:GvpL/GvpF family gas vesicle protein n=1 Tax=Hyphomicrobium sp. TaxID=82 RepID=UPI001327C53F|nr:GvpL/GvpF family gas vesicle protein [Hyphomicrobium sp.]KAB2939862.1 MAG: GvpL/GvpF family gas vesicle protein [Hyphomicrobium sp.]MBZ0208653.1 GvpL/GvpF family gas vesicle protein [Hyphomicrobium sp.]
MMSYVYAITDRPDAVLPGGSGLAQIVFRDIGAVVSPSAGSHVTATAEKLWQHEQVVESLMSARTVLPMRFGTLLASFDEVEDMLRRGYPMFVEDIARVRDHVEVGIRFMVLREPRSTQISFASSSASRLPPSHGLAQSATAPGTAYLRAKSIKEHERGDRRRPELEPVRKTYRILAEYAAASKLDDDVEAPTVSAAFLVNRDGLPSFRQLVARLADERPELALLCTGPWPAYSFVSAHVGKSAQKVGS